MNKLYGYDSEAFDMSTNAEINKKKNKKNFKIILILSIVIIIAILIFAFWFFYKQINTVKMEPIKKDITASGEYFYGQRVAVIETQIAIVKDKKTYLILKSSVDNNDYISNKTITVYKDGTYLIDFEEAYQSNYRNERTMGYVDLTLIDNYIEENKEVLLKMFQYDYENGEDPFVDCLLINIDGTYVFGESARTDDMKYKNDLEEIFVNSEKEEVQKFNMIEE